MVISEIELSDTKKLKIHLDNVNGIRFGHIRIWVRKNPYDILKPSTKGFGFDLKYLDELIKGLITLKAMEESHRSSAQAILSKKQKYYVYVIGLKPTALNNRKCIKQNPKFKPGPNKKCYYVGYTGETPEIRYNKHITGYRNKRGKTASSIVEKHGYKKNGLRPSQYRSINPLATKEEAEKMEIKLAERLRKNGHFVYQK